MTQHSRILGLLVTGLLLASWSGAQPRPGPGEPLTPGKPAASAAWAQELLLQYDDPTANNVDRFLSRQQALTKEVLQPVLDELAPLASWADVRGQLIVSLPSYNPVWRAEALEHNRLLLIASRAKLLTSEQWDRWATDLGKATGGSVGVGVSSPANFVTTLVLLSKLGMSPDVTGQKMTRAWVVLLVLGTDDLFSSDGYRDTAAARVLARLERIPPESTSELAVTVRFTRGQAAMSIATADFAFNNDDFVPSAFHEALLSLRQLLPPRK